MGRLLTFLAQLQRWPHARRLDAAFPEPRAAQERLLREILSANAETEYGRRHGFATVATLDEYRRAAPIVGYDDIRELVERQTRGETAVLTAEKPHYYCCTAGTTGTPKFNCVTTAYREQFQRTVHAFAYHLFRDHPGAGRGKVLYFVGSSELGRTRDATPYGTMSGYTYRTLPAVARRSYAVPYEAFQIADLPTKYYAVTRCAMARDVTLAVAITPTPLTSVVRCMRQRTEALIRDVHDGTLAVASELDEATREALTPWLAPDPARARRLTAAAERGPLTAPAVWPDLAAATCWIGAAAGMYVPELRRCFPGVPLRDAIFSATEGWCNVPLRDETPGGPLALNSHVYEFIPEDEYEKPDRRVLAVDELEAGRRYYLVLTTAGGCYRYDLRDVMHVDGFHGGTPVVRFAYKGGHCCNLAGEKMTEAHVNEVVTARAALDGCEPTWFVLVPRRDATSPGYDLWLEPRSAAAAPDASELGTWFDAALRRTNWEYESHRACGDLGPLWVRVLPPGTWDALRGNLAGTGAGEAQMKPPHLTERAEVVEHLRAARARTGRM